MNIRTLHVLVCGAVALTTAEATAQVRLASRGGRQLPTLGHQAPVGTAPQIVTPHEPIPLSAITAGDLDGDGDPDLLLGGMVCWNDHGGDFRRTTLMRGGRVQALGDVDGDGDLDVCYGEGHRTYNSGGVLGLMINQGGTFAVGPTLGGGRGVDARFADLDGDGDLDLVAAFEFTGSPLGTVFVWHNDGAGNFTDVTASVLAAPMAGEAQRIGVTDLDGDGDLDIVALPYWLRNDGTGHYASVSNWLPGTSPTTRHLLVADLDEDGDADVLTDLGVQRNDGAGVFTPTGSLPFVLSSAIHPDNSGFATADLDGDGHVEIVGGFGGFGVRPFAWRDAGGFVYQDVTGAWFEPHALRDETIDYTFQYVAVADLNGDGRPDLVTGGEEGRSGSSTTVGVPPHVFVNQGGTRFADTARAAFPFAEGPVENFDVGDVDGDGRLDVLATGSRLWLQDTTGAFFGREVPALGEPRDGRLVDVDGDGDLDLLAVGGGSRFSQTTTRQLLALNDGHGVFTDVSAARLPATPIRANVIVVGDVDGDGDVDAVIARSFGDLVLWRNDGNGMFTEDPTALPPVTVSTHRLALADLDGDGALDLVVVKGEFFSLADPIAVLRNGGSGIFTDVSATNVPAGLLYCWELQVRDLDRDGDLDIVSNQARLVNDGTGSFTAIVTTNAMLLADLDQDGLDDELSPWLMVAGQGFTWGWPGIGGFTTHFALDADLDDDGDLDLLVGSKTLFGGHGEVDFAGVLWNQLRDLRFATLPRLGQPFELELRAGSSTGTAALVAAGALLAQPVALGALGDLWLDPASIVLLGVVVVPDADTAGRLTVTLPNRPVFAGLPLATQALFGPLGNGRAEHLSAAPQEIVLH